MDEVVDKAKLISNYEAAWKKVQEGKTGASGTENAYGVAYQKLVAANLRPQLRGKYRGN